MKNTQNNPEKWNLNQPYYLLISGNQAIICKVLANENNRFFNFPRGERRKIGCIFPEKPDFNLISYRLFYGNMTQKRKFCVRHRSAKNAGKPYQAYSGGLFPIRTRWWRRAFPSGTGAAVLGDVNWLAGGVSGCVVREEFSSLFFD